MKQIDRDIRILTTEPLVNIVPALEAGENDVQHALAQHENQFQVLDMLTGKICPELGGKPEYLDMLGVNYYYNNQWIVGTGQFLPWANENEDTRWRSFSCLVREVHERYNRPVILTETSHPGEHRPNWLIRIAKEITVLLKEQIPFWGICLYPIIDRPDWDYLEKWHNSGLWDTDVFKGCNSRVLCEEYAEAVLQSQRLIESVQEADYSYLQLAI